MKLIQATHHRKFFEVLASTRDAQAAMMVLRPGQSSGEPDNEHPRADQWLFVISGTGRARVGKRSVALKQGSLLLIEKGEVHQITNTGRRDLMTINFYSPPAYTAGGELRRPPDR